MEFKPKTKPKPMKPHIAIMHEYRPDVRAARNRTTALLIGKRRLVIWRRDYRPVYSRPRVSDEQIAQARKLMIETFKN